MFNFNPYNLIKQSEDMNLFDFQQQIIMNKDISEEEKILKISILLAENPIGDFKELYYREESVSMIIKVDTIYEKKYMLIPDGFIKDIYDEYDYFLDWIYTQPRNVKYVSKNEYALSYNEMDFLRYINTVTLGGSEKKAYFLEDCKMNDANMDVIVID